MHLACECLCMPNAYYLEKLIMNKHKYKCPICNSELERTFFTTYTVASVTLRIIIVIIFLFFGIQGMIAAAIVVLIGAVAYVVSDGEYYCNFCKRSFQRKKLHQ